MKKDNFDCLAKLLIIGDSGVGKTNILLRFCENSFIQSHLTTIGIDFKIKTLEINGKKIKMQIWDTAGQERFKTITQTYYKGAQGIILTYSITDRDSFTHIENWMNQIRKHAGENVQQILIGNKADLGGERQVQFSEGEGSNQIIHLYFENFIQALAKENKIKFLEASAYTNYNVTELFSAIGSEILEKIIDNNNDTPENNNNLILQSGKTGNNNEKLGKSGCC